MAQVGLYKIKSIAEMTGFSPNLLRAWERRYQLLKPERKPSGHRLYTDEDRRVLLAVKALMAEGRSIGEIAAGGRQSLLSGDLVKELVPPSEEHPLEAMECSDLPQVKRFRDEIVEGALSLDKKKVDNTLDECFASLDRETIFCRVMVMAIRRIGDLWSSGEASVAHERLASELFCRRIYHWLGVVGRQQTGGEVVISACLPDEQHDLGALLVTYFLTSAGGNVTFLGSLPFTDLEIACRDLCPSIVLLSVTRPELFDVHQPRLAEVIARHPSIRFVLGGIGLRERAREVHLSGAEFWSPERPLTEVPSLLLKTS